VTEISACPYCGVEMEKGFIVSNYGIWWNDHVPRVICGRGEWIASSFWTCAGVPGFRCNACSIIVFHVLIAEPFTSIRKRGLMRMAVCDARTVTERFSSRIL
jgi:hypothetical protein